MDLQVKLQKQKEYRNRTSNSVTKAYEKTKKGFLMRTYRNMKSRVSGVLKNKNHLYLGKELLDKEIFYEFSLNNNSFNLLFENWEKSNYDLLF